MRHHWTKEEEKVLIAHYAHIGAIGCSEILSRSRQAIRKKARKLKLFTKTTLGGVVSKKSILKQISPTRGLVLCSRHGYTPHYLSKYRSPVCLICRREWDKKRSKKQSRKLQTNRAQRQRYKIPIYNYANRLRRTLRLYSHGEISFSKHLPYSADQLCDHLEDIRIRQHNRCPMCNISYDISGYDIDHVIPVSTAEDMYDILCLFDLDNLSLLCPSCNRHIKRDNDTEARRGKVGVVKCH